MQYAAGIGLSVPTTETDLASDETTSSEPSDNAIPGRPASVSATGANAAFTQALAKSPANDLAKSTTAPTARMADEAAKASEADKPKTTHVADRPQIAEPATAPPASSRAPEALPQPTANTATPTPDNISAPPPAANISAAAESSVDMPAKLTAATREGQTAEMQTLALHIAARWAKGDSRFTIRLDPPELGRIEVNLSVSSHGHAQAVLAVEKPQTLDLLLRDAPTLERALKDAGLELGSDLSFSLKEEGRPNFARDDQYSPPARTLELAPSEAADSHPALNAGLVEQLYGLRTARLDITV